MVKLVQTVLVAPVFDHAASFLFFSGRFVILFLIFLANFAILAQSALTKVTTAERRLAMSIRVIAPTNDLLRDISARNFLWINSAKDENLQPQAGRMIHEDFNGLRRGDGKRLFVIAAD